MTHPNDPAMPSVGKILSGISEFPGLTKREYFAAMAMTPMYMYGSDNKQAYLVKADELAKSCVAYADALIAELNRKAE